MKVLEMFHQCYPSQHGHIVSKQSMHTSLVFVVSQSARVHPLVVLRKRPKGVVCRIRSVSWKSVLQAVGGRELYLH